MRVHTFLAFTLLLACGSVNERTITAGQAEKISDDHFAETWPQVRRDRFRKSVRDAGDRWRVIYSSPSEMMRPDLSVEIDKKSGKIVRGLRGPCYTDERKGWQNPCEFGQLGSSESAFLILDENKDGKIIHSEWDIYSERALKKLNQKNTEMGEDYRTQLHLLFEYLDLNKDYSVSKTEWDKSELPRFDKLRR